MVGTVVTTGSVPENTLSSAELDQARAALDALTPQQRLAWAAQVCSPALRSLHVALVWLPLLVLLSVA